MFTTGFTSAVTDMNQRELRLLPETSASRIEREAGTQISEVVLPSELSRALKQSGSEALAATAFGHSDTLNAQAPVPGEVLYARLRGQHLRQQVSPGSPAPKKNFFTQGLIETTLDIQQDSTNHLISTARNNQHQVRVLHQHAQIRWAAAIMCRIHQPVDLFEQG